MADDTRQTTHDGVPAFAVRDKDSLLAHDVGDNPNRAVRVNVVAGGSGATATVLQLKGSDNSSLAAVDPNGAVHTTSANLESRMLGSQPQTGWSLWFDTADTSYLYLLEALATKVTTDTGFQGIRVTLDANGNPVGKVQINTGATLTFSNRKTDGNWS